MYQSYTSALVVFHNVLYAFVPWASSSTKGMGVFRYNGTSFDHLGDYGTSWCTAVAAVVCDKTLYLACRSDDGSNRLIWSYTSPGVTAITNTGGFSPTLQVPEQSSSNPALFVRNGQVVLLFLALGDGRSVLETTLTMGANPVWNRGDDTDQSGDSGVSAVSTPDGKHAWMCFKRHGGFSNLICHYMNKDKNGLIENWWSDNESMGTGSILECYNEAALVCSDGWLYAIWNTYGGNSPMFYSRRPLKKLPTDSWMAEIVNPDISVSQLSIPGTHDSATAYFPISYAGRWVCCQSMTIQQQLNAGIRYFDLRCGYESASGPLKAYHGDYALDITISDIFKGFYKWLSQHTTEGIIVQIKCDNDKAKPGGVPNDVYSLINGNSHWVTTNTIPTLRQIQGKIQLIRRIGLPTTPGAPTSWGIDATNWPQNTQATITIPSTTSGSAYISIEDYYEYDEDGAEALSDKWSAVEEFLGLAVASSGPNSWYIGYTSYGTTAHTSFPHIDIPDTPLAYATRGLMGKKPLNTSLEEYVRSKGRFRGPHACLGTLVMDFPELPSGTLIESIIYTNALKAR